jgi:hypothetical protein
VAFLIPENLRSRRDVPPGVTRLARLLQEALDDEATVWYEPIFDGTGERPDVVVLVPDAGVLVVEVLGDKPSAIRGADAGKLLISDGTIQRSLEDPLSRAARFAADLRARISKEPRLHPDDQLPVAAAGVFAYLSRADAMRLGLESALDVDSCLFRDDLDVAVQDCSAFRRTVSRLLRAPLRDLLSAEAEKLHRGLIHPDTVIGSAQLPFPSFTPEETLKVLDRQQEALAKSLGEGHRVVRGVAGSGKTLVLTYRARLLAEAFPKQRVLVTCFNKSLKGSLSRQLKIRNVTIATVDDLMNRALRGVGEPVPDFKKVPELADRGALALRALEKNADAAERFDHVLVDEAQDFPTEALQFVVRLLKDGSDSLLVVADAAQNIYRQKFTWKAAGINAVGRTRVLATSYRNTREILQYAHDFLLRDGTLRVEADGAVDDEGAVIPPHFSDRSGPMPTWLYRETPQQEVLAIVEHCRKLLDRGVTAGEIAVLYGVRNAGGFQWTDGLRKAFEATRIPLFWATDPANPSNKFSLGAHPDHVTLSTIFSAKGLEFKHVILCGYLDDQPPERQIINRRVIYVGMTRATHELVLTASGKHEFIADLEI